MGLQNRVLILLTNPLTKSNLSQFTVIAPFFSRIHVQVIFFRSMTPTSASINAHNHVHRCLLGIKMVQSKPIYIKKV
jgi:hypothetical protein